MRLLPVYLLHDLHRAVGNHSGVVAVQQLVAVLRYQGVLVAENKEFKFYGVLLPILENVRSNYYANKFKFG